MPERRQRNECVILLHGLGRTHLSMRRMQKAFVREGFDVVNIDYPSRKLNIAELAEQVIEQCLQLCPPASQAKIHFVTHSLGGILVRQYTQQRKIPGLQRVVMLGPPNQGSEIVDTLRSVPGYRWLNGPAGQQLGTGDLDLPKKLGAVNFELGVIAGKRSMNLILSRLIPGQNDGKVSVESTRVEGMADFITLPTTHTFMMQNQKVIQQAIHFINFGHFMHES